MYAKEQVRFFRDLEEQKQQERADNYARYCNEPQCDHSRREFRQQTNTVGQQCFYWQCLDCNTYQQIARAKLPEGIAIDDLQKVDRTPRINEWRAAYYEEDSRICGKYDQLLEERLQEDRVLDSEARVFYSDYMQSNEWYTKRELVLARDNYVCQGCLKRRATQVHHLTYEHLGVEFMWELLSICDECHSRLHLK